MKIIGPYPFWLFFLSCFSYTVMSYGQSSADHFKLMGEIQQSDNSYLYLRYTNAQKKDFTDSALISNGSFQFEGNITEPTIASIFTKDGQKSLLLYLEPNNMKVAITPAWDEHTVISGSRSQNEYIEIEAGRKRIKKKYQAQIDSLISEKDKEKKQQIRDRLAPYFQEVDDADLEFFRSHPQSYVTAYELRYYTKKIDLDTLKQFYGNLGPAIQKSIYAEKLVADIAALELGLPGKKAMPFSTADINGNTIELKQFSGHYVVLDFWASWCIPCRQGHPYLIGLYNKYKNKGVAFVGISDDDNATDKWKKAVEEDKLPWIQILRGFNANAKLNNGNLGSDIHRNYGVRTLPLSILIDGEGTIVGRFEDKKELGKALEKLFTR